MKSPISLLVTLGLVLTLTLQGHSSPVRNRRWTQQNLFARFGFTRRGGECQQTSAKFQTAYEGQSSSECFSLDLTPYGQNPCLLEVSECTQVTVFKHKDCRGPNQQFDSEEEINPFQSYKLTRTRCPKSSGKTTLGLEESLADSPRSKSSENHQRQSFRTLMEYMTNRKFTKDDYYRLLG